MRWRNKVARALARMRLRRRRTTPRVDWAAVVTRPSDTHDFYASALSIALKIASARRNPLILVWRGLNVALVLLALTTIVWGMLQVRDAAILPVRDVVTRLLTPEVAAGTSVKVRFMLDRTKVCAVDVAPIVFDGADEPVPLPIDHRDAGGPLGPDHFARAFAVPPDAAPGRARLRIVWSYVCPGNYAQVLSPLPLALPDIAFTIVRTR